MHTVLIYSEKGGVGKSAISNMIAFGAALAKEGQDYDIVVAHMDNRSPVEPIDDRGYSIIDLRNEKQAITVIERAKDSDISGILVIDIGANKTRLAERLAGICDIVLIPMEGDFDSVRLAVEALQNPRFHDAQKGAYVITNRTPSPKSASRKRFEKNTLSVPMGSVLYRFPQLSAVSELARPTSIDSRVKSKIKYQSLKLFSAVESSILTG